MTSVPFEAQRYKPVKNNEGRGVAADPHYLQFADCERNRKSGITRTVLLILHQTASIFMLLLDEIGAAWNQGSWWALPAAIL